MFLTSDNKLNTKSLAWGSVITALLIMGGMVWFDKPLFVLLRKLDCGLWRIFDYVFDAKIWLALTAILLLVVYIKKSLDLGVKYKNTNSKFSISVLFKDFMGKVRTNYAFLIFSSVLSAGVIAKIIKICVGRFRPVFFEAFGMTGFRPFSLEWAFNSMPSGHTAASFAGLVMIGLLFPRAKYFTWTLAIIIAFSRVYVGAHWVGDVVLGAFIGMLCADFVKAILKKINAK
jgi:membrane-associated phospholipid phosphatase